MKTFFPYILSACLLVSGVYTLRTAYAHGYPAALADCAEVVCASQSASAVQLNDQQIWCNHLWLSREKPTHVVRVYVLEKRETEEDEDESRSLTRFGAACISSVFLSLSSDNDDLHGSSLHYRDLVNLSSPGRYLTLRVFRI